MIPYHIFFGGGLSIYLAVDAAFCSDFTFFITVKMQPQSDKNVVKTYYEFVLKVSF